MTATNVAFGWLGLRSLLNNAHSWTFQALTNIKNTTPFPVLAFHSGNDSEFINNATKIWCKKRASSSPAAVTTRSMTTVCGNFVAESNKNVAVVREYVGYDQFAGFEEHARLAAMYRPLVPLLNFFMPTQQFKSKTSVSSKAIKVYDELWSPFQRRME